jgi:hypothetical protein
MKGIHVDLTMNARDALLALTTQLDQALQGERLDQQTYQLMLASPAVREIKLKGLLGEPEQYQVAEFGPGYTPNQGVLAAHAIIAASGLHSTYTGNLVTVDVLKIGYGDDGQIHTAEDDRLVGKDVFHYLSGCIDQEVALVLKDGERLVYAADISRFEKTPKDPVTGINRMIGHDLMAFHGATPTHGDLLPSIFQKLVSCMAQGSLDILTVDLEGQQRYLYDGETVRRRERDSFTPLIDGRGLQGILATADVYFQGESSHRHVRPLQQPPLRRFLYGVM